MWWQKRKPDDDADAWKQAEFTPGIVVRTDFAESAARAAEFIADAETMPFPSEGPHGHRERMRDRLLERGPDSLADYELIEMLLFYAQPKGDTKPIAKRLMNRFGSYADTLVASPQELAGVEGIGRHSIAALKLVHGAALRLARARILNAPILGNWEQLMDYLNAAMARERVEQFRILFLDTKNRLIADEVQGRGTINHTPVYPREVVRRAMELHSAALIIVHNHPSGDPTPSMPDIEMTEQLNKVLSALGFALHDHIIVGNGRSTSLRKEGFL